MSGRRIWLEADEIHEPEMEISGEAFRHAVQVLRFSVGDEFEIVYGGPDALRVVLERCNKKSMHIRILGRRKLPELQRPHIGLAVAVAKWNVFEEIIEKSVELGAAVIQPLITEHSFVRKVEDISESRWQRFQKIVQSAMAQSGRGEALVVRPPKTLADFAKTINQNSPNRIDNSVGLFAYEGLSALTVREQLETLRRLNPKEVWPIIGPEGGFSQKEVTLLQENGLPPVTLGEHVLRAETACFAILSVIKYEFGLMR